MGSGNGTDLTWWQRFTKLLRFFWGVVRGYLMMVGLLVTLLPILIIFSLRFSASKPTTGMTTLPDKGFVLHLHYDGQVVAVDERSPMAIFSSLWRTGDDLALDEWQRTMRSVAVDERVKGLLITIHQLSGQWTDFAEARRNLQVLRTKRPDLPIVFHMATAGNSEYYLASAGTQIALTPAGDLDIPGPIFTLSYFREALAKLGVQFEVIKFGKYKSAMEAFSEDKPTPAARAMFEELEQGLRAHLVDTVAAARGLDRQVVDGWFKQGMFNSKEALEGRLIDLVNFEDEMRVKILADSKVEDWVDGGTYTSERGDLLKKLESRGNDGVGIIYAVGEIHLSRANDPQGENITPAAMREQLEYMAEKEAVKSVVLRIDSPGGSALASDMIWRDVLRLAEAKPVVVSMGSVAASGGYYIASSATRILAEAPTITGSIGVIAAIPNFAAGESKFGVHFETITQSDRARLYNPGSPMGPFDRALLENQIAVTYQMFLERVAQGRGMEVPAVHELAQGNVYTGAKALDLRLVDEIGGLSDAFRVAKELGKLDSEKLYKVYEYEGETPSFLRCLSDRKSWMKCVDYLGVHIAQSMVQQQSGLNDAGVARLATMRKFLEREKVLTWLPVDTAM